MRLPLGGKTVRYKPEYLLIGILSVFAITGVVATSLDDGADFGIMAPPRVEPVLPLGTIEPAPDARGWFEQVRPSCNSVDVQTRLDRQPPPPTPEGAMHAAACYALAGRIDRARVVIEGLPEGMRYQAAGVVFEVGHPAADAGDEVAAGPLMELVVEYWPNHYMALYHAGAARFESRSYPRARSYLERFLDEYSAEDGWRASAISMLERIEGASR
jgi:hypothetical protein